MKFSRVIFALLFAIPAALGQTVTVTAAHLGGKSAPSGVIVFQPTACDAAKTPVSVRLSGGGLTSRLPLTATVAAGAFTLSNVTDSSASNPANVCYSVTFKANNGLQILGPGFDQVQTAANNGWCSNSVCNFDNYTPAMNALAVVVAGPKGADSTVPGPKGDTGAVVANSATGPFQANYGLTSIGPFSTVAHDWSKAGGGNSFLFREGSTFRNFASGTTFPSGNYAAYLYQRQQICNSAHAGWNGDGTSFNFSCDYRLLNSWSSGIFNILGLVYGNYRDGDINVVRSYGSGRLSRMHGGEEGNVLFGGYWNGGSHMIGTFATDVPVGATTASVACTGDCSTASVNSPLVDTSTVLTGLSISAITNGTVPLATLSGGTVTPQPWCTAAVAVNTPTTPRNMPVGMNVQLTGCTAALGVGQNITISGPFWEMATITAVPSPFSGGAETITVGLTEAYLPGAIVSKTGPYQFMDRTVMSSVAGQPYAFYIAGYPDSTHIFVGQRDQTGIGGGGLATGPIALYSGSVITDPGNACTFANMSTNEPGEPCTYGGNGVGTVNVGIMPSPVVLANGHAALNMNNTSAGLFGTRLLISDPNPYLQMIGHEVRLPGSECNPNNVCNMAGGTGIPVITSYRPPTISNGGPLHGAIFSQGYGQFGSANLWDMYFGGDYFYNGQPQAACVGMCFAPGAHYPAGSNQPPQNFLFDPNTGVYGYYNPVNKSLKYGGLSGGMEFSDKVLFDQDLTGNNALLGSLLPRFGDVSGHLGVGGQSWHDASIYEVSVSSLIPLDYFGPGTSDVGSLAKPYRSVNVNSVTVGGVVGFTGTKTAGACTFTIASGVITAVSGC